MEPSCVDFEAKAAASTTLRHLYHLFLSFTPIDNVTNTSSKKKKKKQLKRSLDHHVEIYEMFEEGKLMQEKIFHLLSDNFCCQANGLIRTNTTSDDDVDEIQQIHECLSTMNCLTSFLKVHAQLKIIPSLSSRLSGILNNLRPLIAFNFTSSEDPAPNPHHGEVRKQSIAFLRITTILYPDPIQPALSLYLPERRSRGSSQFYLYQKVPSLITILLHDAFMAVRLEAAFVVKELIGLIEISFHQRGSGGKKTKRSQLSANTFVLTFEKKLGIVETLYQAFSAGLQKLLQARDEAQYFVKGKVSDTTVVLIPLLKAIVILFQSCPWKSLLIFLEQNQRTECRAQQQEIMAQIIKQCHWLFNSAVEVHDVRIAVVSCLCAFFGSTASDMNDRMTEHGLLGHPVFNIQEYGQNLIVRSSPIQEDHSPQGKASLLQSILYHSMKNTCHSSTIRLESMSLLGKVCRQYPQVVLQYWIEIFAPYFRQTCNDPEPNIRLLSVKTMEHFLRGKKAKEIIFSSHDDDRDAFYMFIIKELSRAFRDPCHHVRANVCSCFGVLTDVDWKALSTEHQDDDSSHDTVHLQQYILDIPTDASPVVRAAGFRLIGSLLALPLATAATIFHPQELRQIVHLVLDHLHDSTLNVRVRATWALSNLCKQGRCPDLTWIMRSESGNVVPQLRLIDMLGLAVISHLTADILQCLNDNDKVVANVVRALGYLTSWIGCPLVLLSCPEKEDMNMEELVEKCILALCEKLLPQNNNCSQSKSTSGKVTTKVQWNACHALGRILSTPELAISSATWTPILFSNLLKAIKETRNYKVSLDIYMYIDLI